MNQFRVVAWIHRVPLRRGKVGAEPDCVAAAGRDPGGYYGDREREPFEIAIPRPYSPHSLHGGGAKREGTRCLTFTDVGRSPDTLRTVTAELNAEGTDYVLLPDSLAPYPPLFLTVQTLLTESPTRFICHDLRERWPGLTPREDSLRRTLVLGVERGFFAVAGKGTKTEPLRFGVVRPVLSTNGAQS